MRLLPVVVLALVLALGGAAPARAETSIRDVVLNPESLADPDTLIDLGGMAFDQAVDAFVPDELPIKVPGLGDLGPVTMEDATVTIERPDDVLQLGGWKITIEDTVQFEINGTDRPLAFTIGLEWESEEGDFSPVVEFDVEALAPLSVADILQVSGLLAADAETQETLAGETSVSDVAFAFHWDDDGPSPRTWLDVTGTTTFGTSDIAVSYLFAYDSGGSKGEHFITAVRVDNTDPDATTITLGELVNGDWGTIAGALQLPEFVLAKVSGLPDGETLGRNDLRLGGIPLRFFAGCDTCVDELPEDLELDATLALLAKFDLAELGDVVGQTFDYPDDDSVVDLYGKLGLTFSSVEGTDPVSLDQVRLRAEVPQSGGVNSLLPEWLSTGPWTFTVEYDSDPLVGGITVGARTVISADVDDDQVFDFDFDTLATFTRTIDGTISVGVQGTSNTTWDDPFGVEWLDLTSLGIGASITENAGGAAAFDAALTSTFELCAPGCAEPSVGRVEARLGVTDDAQVQFRIAFGEDGSTVPIGALLAPIAEELGAAPDLTGAIGSLQLDDLVFAVTVDTTGAVTFESFAGANLGFLGDITSYLYVEAGGTTPRFFFGARPTDGVTLGQLLAPNPTDPAPPEVLDGIELPTLGVLAAPVGGFESTSTQLSKDGFEFFAPLYGCAPGATAADCDFAVGLEPGVNLLANITFPGALTDLAEALWLDAERGIQFQGTLALPGIFDPGAGAEVKLGLRLTLPRLEPGDAAEFIEDGSLTLGVELEAGTDPKIALFVEGLLNTRWRHGTEPIESGDPCPLTSVAMAQFEDPSVAPEDNPTWCYDRLQFRVRSALELTPAGVKVSLLGGLSAPNGWQQPFGVPGFEWLVINDLVVKVEVQLPGATGTGVTVNAGFLGEIEIDNGDPDTPNTVLQASFGAGVTIQPIPGPPGVSLVPNFKGLRAYVSRIGVADVAALQEAIFPPPPGSGLDVSALPNVEFQNVEFMFAIASDADLCLEPRIGFAGELWIDPQRDGAGGDVPTDGPCRPFGAEVDPAECLANQDLGCFASVNVTIGLDGIFASGSVGEFGIGPVRWEGGLIDLRLKLGEAPILAVSGGVVVEDLGAGRLAMRLELVPVAKVDFFGYLSAFDAFEVQVDGSLELRLDPLFPPQLQSDMALHAALRADFDSYVQNAVRSELQRVASSLDDFDAALELLAQDPIGNLAEARDALANAGVALPDWMDGFIDFVEFVDDDVLPAGAPLPTFDQLVNGEPYEYRTDANRSCNWFDEYDADDDRCIDSDGDRYTPDFWCWPPGTLDGDECVVTITLPDIGDFVSVAMPPTWSAALEDIYDGVVDAITDLDLVPNIAGLGIDEYLYGLADRLADARFLDVECAEFAWTAGAGAGDVRILLLLSVLGQQYGFDVALDLTTPQAGVETIVSELLELFLTFGEQDVECTGEQTAPGWLASIQGGAATPLVLELAPAGPVDEGAAVTVSGTITPAATEPIDIDLAWGDGSSETLTGVTGGSFSATHSYADDDPTGTASDGYTVSASTATAAGPALTTIEVRNVAPEVTITSLDADDRFVADEGESVSLAFSFTDVAADSHRAVVHWGDGTTTTLPTVQSPVTVEHTYLDDDPTGTPFDDVTDGISVVVTDDDTGATTTTADLRVVNGAPVVTFPDASVDANGVATIEVQYSDPLGGDPTTGDAGAFRIVADDVAADDLALRTSFAGTFGTPGWLAAGDPECAPIAPVHQRCTWDVSAVADATSGIHTDIAPGTYDLVLSVVDDDTGASGVVLRVTVLPEDARTWYEGTTFAATESAESGSATVELRATVRDITSAVPETDPQWDPWPGDIRNATMTFRERATTPTTLCAAPAIDEVFAPFDVFDADTSIGVGTCDWTSSIAADAVEHTVATVIGGYYSRDETTDDAVVTIARPLDEFITGGGYLVLDRSSGVYAGDPGTKANFGFHVKFNTKRTNLIGGANIIVRQGDRVYQIKSNSTTSLGAAGIGAQFEAKANITDVTDEASPDVIGGNFVLQMRMEDRGEGERLDVVSFALWDIRKVGSGKTATTTQLLLFSSNWDGQRTILQQLAGGNLMVHAGRAR
ncbi:MAG TPA: hypothetical protein VFZ83_16560 [Acidimicrobiia bacterium]|nr:hypothetical protein [Acidimicrobiia bacterium]